MRETFRIGVLIGLLGIAGALVACDDDPAESNGTTTDTGTASDAAADAVADNVSDTQTGDTQADATADASGDGADDAGGDAGDDGEDDTAGDAGDDGADTADVREEDMIILTACESTCMGLFDVDCTDDDEITDVWEDADACITDCELAGEDEEDFLGCLGFTVCDDPSPCNDLPDAAASECTDACAALGTECDELSLDSCVDDCTLFLHAGGLDVGQETADINTCIDGATDTCPGDGDTSAIELLIVGCALESPEACTTACDELSECDAPNCVPFCTWTSITTPELITGLQMCLETQDDACVCEP